MAPFEGPEPSPIPKLKIETAPRVLSEAEIQQLGANLETTLKILPDTQEPTIQEAPTTPASPDLATPQSETQPTSDGMPQEDAVQAPYMYGKDVHDALRESQAPRESAPSTETKPTSYMFGEEAHDAWEKALDGEQQHDSRGTTEPVSAITPQPETPPEDGGIADGPLLKKHATTGPSFIQRFARFIEGTPENRGAEQLEAAISAAQPVSGTNAVEDTPIPEDTQTAVESPTPEQAAAGRPWEHVSDNPIYLGAANSRTFEALKAEAEKNPTLKAEMEKYWQDGKPQMDGMLLDKATGEPSGIKVADMAKVFLGQEQLDDIGRISYEKMQEEVAKADAVIAGAPYETVFNQQSQPTIAKTAPVTEPSAPQEVQAEMPASASSPAPVETVPAPEAPAVETASSTETTPPPWLKEDMDALVAKSQREKAPWRPEDMKSYLEYFNAKKTKIESEAQKKGLGERLNRWGEAYSKLNWKKKIAISGGLLGAGIGAGAIGGTFALTLGGGVWLARRGLGAIGAYYGTRNALNAWQERRGAENIKTNRNRWIARSAAFAVAAGLPATVFQEFMQTGAGQAVKEGTLALADKASPVFKGMKDATSRLVYELTPIKSLNANEIIPGKQALSAELATAETPDMHGPGSAADTFEQNQQNAAQQAIESKSAAFVHDPRLEHIVGKGENTWRILGNVVDEKFPNFKTGQKIYIIDALKDHLLEIQKTNPALLNEIGFKSGNIDLIRPNETLDLNKLFQEPGLMDKIVNNAKHLSAAQLASINENLQPKKPADISPLNNKNVRVAPIDRLKENGTSQAPVIGMPQSVYNTPPPPGIAYPGQPPMPRPPVIGFPEQFPMYQPQQYYPGRMGFTPNSMPLNFGHMPAHPGNIPFNPGNTPMGPHYRYNPLTGRYDYY